MKKKTTSTRKMDVLPLPPTTTEQQDLTYLGQRKINIVWEYTQAFLAIFVTITVMGLGTFLGIVGRADDLPTYLALAFGLIIGFYFGRTNHTNVGGVGERPKVTNAYRGR